MSYQSRYDDIKDRVKADHEYGMSYTELAAKYGIPSGSIGGIIHGWRNRRNSGEADTQAQRQKTKLRKCSKCGAEAANPKAHFCWKCGADIRSKETILLEDLQKLYGIVSLIPSSQADAGMEILRELEAYLKERG